MNLKIILQLMVTVAIFIFIFVKRDLFQILLLLQKAETIYLSAAILSMFLLYAVKTKKWEILLQAIGERTDFAKEYTIIILSMFYCLVTPGRAGELARAWFMKSDKAKIISTVMLDKIIDILVLIILSDILILAVFKNPILTGIMCAVTIGFIIAMFIVLNAGTTNFILRMLRISPKSTKNYLAGISQILKDRRAICRNIGYSFVYYSMCILIAYLVLSALQNNANLLLSASFPINILLGNLPIAISGLGLREYITMVCFETLNESPDLGFALSITLFTILTLIPGILGGILSLKAKVR